MPVCTFVTPCNHQVSGGYVIHYGVGQYWIDGMAAFDWHLMLHMKDRGLTLSRSSTPARRSS
jgi:hypothetical protein